MEGTAFDILVKPELPTRATERRERRRERILRDFDKRINSILSGPDGSESSLIVPENHVKTIGKLNFEIQ